MIKNLACMGACVGGLLISSVVLAGAPEGHYRSIDRVIKYPLRDALTERGYIGRSPASAFHAAIRAYLWDNRRYLVTNYVPKEREIDLVVCLLGWHEGDQLFRQIGNAMFDRWCREQLREQRVN